MAISPTNLATLDLITETWVDAVAISTMRGLIADIPAASATYEGCWFTATDTDRTYLCDGTGWVLMSEPLQNYTPTLTNMTLGNGTRTGYYQRSGGWVDFAAQFTLGSTSAMGTSPSFDLPIVAGTSVLASHFTAGMLQSAVLERPLYPVRLTSGATAINIRVIDASGTYARDAGITATIPHTWGTGDLIWVSGHYQMTTKYS